ncbi:MAG: AsmA-like C-terminal region-containing protein [Chloroherpetonaceae bacterium]|nr:AsmA-like C-terminal region-containing protein [Chloroherpetonaceae bacterium]
MKKILFAILGFLGLSICLFIAFVYSQLSDEKLRPLINQTLKDNLYRDARVGKISIDFWPLIGLQVSDIFIENRTDSLFTSTKPLLKISSLSVQLNVFSLFKDKLEVSALAVDSLYFFMESDKFDRSNLDSLVKPTGVPEEESASRESSGIGTRFQFLANSISLRGLVFEKASRKSGYLFALNGVDATLGVKSIESLSNLEIAATATLGEVYFENSFGKLLSNTPAEAHSTLQFNLAQGKLTFLETAGTLGNLPIQVTGFIDSLLTERMLFDMTIVSPQSDLKNLLSLLPQAYSKKMQTASASGNFSLELGINGGFSKTELPGFRVGFGLKNGSLQFPSLPKPITGLNLEGKGDMTYFELSSFAASLGQNSVNAFFRIDDFTKKNIALKVSSNLNLAEVKDFYPLEPGTSLSGKLGGTVSLKGSASKPKELKSEGKIVLDGFQSRFPNNPNPIDDISGTLQFNNQKIELQKLQMLIGKNDLSLTGSFTDYLLLVFPDSLSKSLPVFTGSLASHRLNLDDFSSSSSEEKASQPDAKKISTKGLLLPKMLANFTATIDSLQTKGVHLRTVKGRVDYKESKISLSQFSFDFLGGTFNSSGSFNLSNPEKPTFDFNLGISKISIASAFTELPQLTAITGLSGYINGVTSLNFSTTGSLTDSLTPDLNSLFANGLLEISKGKLTGHPIQDKIAGLVKIAELKDYGFEDWRNSFEIRNGRLYISGLNINFGGSTAGVAGSQGLDGSINYAVELKLDQALSAKLDLVIGSKPAQFLKDESGRVPLSFKVGGTLSSPSVSLSEESLLAQAKKQLEAQARAVADSLKREAEAKLQAEKARLEAEARAKIEEEKRKLEEAARAKAEEEKKKLEGKAKEGIRKLFGKP